MTWLTPIALCIVVVLWSCMGKVVTRLAKPQNPGTRFFNSVSEMREATDARSGDLAIIVSPDRSTPIALYICKHSHTPNDGKEDQRFKTLRKLGRQNAVWEHLL